MDSSVSVEYYASGFKVQEFRKVMFINSDLYRNTVFCLLSLPFCVLVLFCVYFHVFVLHFGVFGFLMLSQLVNKGLSSSELYFSLQRRGVDPRSVDVRFVVR